MCDVQGHATQKFPNIPMLHAHLDAMDSTKNIPVVVLSSGPTTKNKSLRKNHACALCGLYGHYSHHFQDLAEFWAALRNIQKHSLESEITVIEEIHPLFLSSTTTTIYTISNSSSLSVSSPVEEPPDLSWHHFRDDGEISKITTSFTPFLLSHGMESGLPTEFQNLPPHTLHQL